jgi:AcrR family transcriptional regulator
MSIVVEHEKRRREILEKSLDVFMDEGFEDVTFQKIADRCGITRTTLYIYFKNKREVFNYSIKQMLSGVEHEIQIIRNNTTLNYLEKLQNTLIVIIEHLAQNRRILSVVLNYLLYLSKSDRDPDTRVRRRTVRWRHILASMVAAGIKAGEIKPVNIKDVDNLLYSILESAVFRLIVLKHTNTEELKASAVLAVQQLAAP